MKQWQAFIQTQTLSDHARQPGISPLQQQGLLYVGGDDAQEFLQNQLSNDIRQIDANRAQLSSFSNAKGRMLGIFRVIAIEGGYLLFMPREIIAEIQTLLQRYVLRSQVVMADVSDSFAMVATSGTDLSSDPRFPQDIHQVYQSDSLISLRLNDSVDGPRYLLISNDPAEAQQVWLELADSCAPSHESAWRLQDIRAGVPSLYSETMGAFVLQMTNLQQLEGVNFKKGCYPGQEVVARMQYLGKLKRRMYRARLSSRQCPKPGQDLRARDASESDSSGKVVDAVATGDGTCELLFVGRIDQAEADNLVLSSEPGASLELIDLPYACSQ